MFEEQITNSVISIIISFSLYFVTRSIIHKKLSELQGSQKISGIISIIIILGEILYLGNEFGLFRVAFEVIASIGVAFGLLSITLQSHLRNAIAGIGIYFNSHVNVGDILEVDGKKGVIIEIHLTKTVLLTEEGNRIFVPNLKFTDSVVSVHGRKNKMDP